MLHVFNDPKFSEGFFEFLQRNNVSLEDQFLFHYRLKKPGLEKYGIRTIYAPGFFSPIPNILLLSTLFKSEKIIIHCLASPALLFYLYLFPSLAHKSYWCIWGKDLYFYKMLEKVRIHHRVYEYFRKTVIKKIRQIITYNEGDYALAKEWYDTNATLFRSFLYPSNCYHPLLPGIKQKTQTVLIGNSADRSNNHLEIFALLKPFKKNDIRIIAPLSYGDMTYAKQVSLEGKRIFGEKFTAIKTLLPFEQYQKMLSNVDIAIFGHKRQQAMGNITTLLGGGKKVYLRNSITTWKFLEELGLKVYDFDDFSLLPPDTLFMKNNMKIVKNTFSEENLLRQWEQIISHNPLSVE